MAATQMTRYHARLTPDVDTPIFYSIVARHVTASAKVPSMRHGASTCVSEITRRRVPVQQFHSTNMELPMLQLIVSVVLSNTINIPPFRYIRPYRYPPCSVHDMTRRSRMIHCNYYVLSTNSKKDLKSAHMKSNSPIKNHALTLEIITSKTSIKSANTQNCHENSNQKHKS